MAQARLTDVTGWCVALVLQWRDILCGINWILGSLTTLYQMQPLFMFLVYMKAYSEDTIMAKPI